MKKYSTGSSFFQAVYRDRLLKVFTVILMAKLLFLLYLTSELSHPESFFATGWAIMLLLSLSLFIKRLWLKLSYLMLFNIAFSVFFLTHALHYKYFLDFATLYEMKYAHLLMGPAAGSVLSMIDKEVLFLLDLPFLPFFAFRLNTTNAIFHLKKANATFFLVVWAMSVICYPFILNRITPSDYFNNEYERASVVQSFGILNYQILDAYVFLTTSLERGSINPQDIALASDWFKDQQNLKEPPDTLTGVGKGMDVIVVQVESMQRFVIGMSVEDHEITPNLNRLMERGIFYTNIYDQTGLGSSSDATFLANCSLYPSRRGAVSFYYFQNDYDSLPKMLRQNGYATATMHGNAGGYWNSFQFEKSIGFEHQYYADSYTIDEVIGWGLSDRSFFSQSIEKIESLPRPFYVFIRTLTSHHPFDYVTTAIDDVSLGNFEGTHMGDYLRSIHYVDAAFGNFMDELSTMGVLSNAIIVVYGDHRAGLSYDELKSIGADPATEDLKIPLIISIPGHHQNEERQTTGGLVDITPTLLNILGIDASDKYFMGRNLNHTVDNDFVIFRDASSIGEPDTPPSQLLRISDLTVEKDLIPRLRGAKEKTH